MKLFLQNYRMSWCLFTNVNCTPKYVRIWALQTGWQCAISDITTAWTFFGHYSDVQPLNNEVCMGCQYPLKKAGKYPIILDNIPINNFPKYTMSLKVKWIVFAGGEHLFFLLLSFSSLHSYAVLQSYLIPGLGSITCKCNRLQLQLLWNFMITDYNNNYFFFKCNRLQLQITLQSNHDYFMITYDYFWAIN